MPGNSGYTATPRKINILKLKNIPIEKENHLPNHLHDFGFKMLIFPGCNAGKSGEHLRDAKKK